MGTNNSGTKSLLSGAAGGLAVVFVGHPFDLVKVRMQTGSLSMVRASADILKADGLRGFYRGALPVLTVTPPMLAVNMWAYYQSQRIVHSFSKDSKTPYVSLEQLSLPQVGVAGFMAAIPTALLLGPAEQIKIRLQVATNNHTGAFQVIKQIFQESGMRGLFRGTSLTILRDCPGSFAYFMTYESIKRKYLQFTSTTTLPMYMVLVAGGFAGIVNWTIAIPMDTLKTRLQSTPVNEAKLPLILKRVMNEGGPKILFRGLSPVLLRAFPASAAFFFGVEMSLSLMNNT